MRFPFPGVYLQAEELAGTRCGDGCVIPRYQFHATCQIIFESSFDYMDISPMHDCALDT